MAKRCALETTCSLLFDAFADNDNTAGIVVLIVVAGVAIHDDHY